MYIEKAIERLNNINWSNIGQDGQKKDMELGIDFQKLRINITKLY